MAPSTTRRGLLASAGAALLAGCSGLDGGDDRTTISIHRLPDYTDDGESEPVVAEQLPVTIEETALKERADRTTALTGSLPIPLSKADIPNGYIRKELLDAAEEAGDHLEAAQNASNRFQAFQRLQHARKQARYAAAGWAYTEGEATEAALEEEHQQAVDDGESLQAEHEYVGDDPVRAALVHAEVEQNLEYGIDDGGPNRREDGLLALAEWGEHAEEARATVEDSRYVYERFRDSLPDDTGTVDERLSTAAERVTEDLDQARRDLPPVPSEAYDQRFYRLRDRLRRAVEDGPRQVADAPGAASATLTATARYVDTLAYDQVVERLESERGIELEEAIDVFDARKTAVEALETALEESRRPALVRPALADAARYVSYADEELARLQPEARTTQLEDPVGLYVAATARANSAPAACDRVLEALNL